MKTEFFSKNSITIIKKSIMAIAAFSIAAGCGGGGGGGSDAPAPIPRSPNITVATVNPIDGAVDVDAQISEIKVTMSADVDPSSFIQEGTALMNLINARKATPEGNGMSITNIVDAAGAAVDITKLKLEQLAAGNYSVVGKYLSNVNGTVQLISGTIKITGYQFVPEENTGLSALNIFVDGGAAPFRFSGAELIASKYVNSNMFRVEKLGTGTSTTAALGQVSVSGRTISFRPINFLEWGSNYQIVLKKDMGNTPDSQGVRELITSGSDTARTIEADKVFKFTTKTLPKAQIVSTSPNGIDASPVGLIRATTNFKVDLVTLNSNTVKLSRIVRTTNVPVLSPATGQQEIPFTLEPVVYTLSYDTVQSQIIITPTGDLRYLQEYQVDIQGGSNGIKGSMGAVTGRYLDEAKYSWNFTTADAKVTSTSVTTNAPTDGNGQAAEFKVRMNFRPDPATVQTGVRLIGPGSTVLTYTSTVANDEITLKPVQPLQYGASYTVEVGTALVSLPLRGTENQNEPIKVSLMNTHTSSFTMEVRKLSGYVPSSGLDISENSSIVLSFNFDIPDSVAVNLSSVVQVTSNVPGNSTTTANVSILRTNSRTIEIKPNVPFTFDATINVSMSFGQIGGTTPVTPGFSVHVVKSNTLTVTSKTPNASASNVSLITEISVGLSHMLKPLTSSQTSTGSSSSAIRVYPRNCSGSYSELSGRITYDTNRIYFLPSSSLKSWCEYEIIVNKDLVSSDGRTQPSEVSWRFNTNGLSVQNVYVTYAYETLVDINESIEVVFNFDLDWSQRSDSVKLYNNRTGSRVSGSLSVWNNKLTFNPSGSLIYGDTYTLTVYSGTWGVEGDDGETMKNDYVVSFKTQNLPIKVDNYGPIGTVRTDSRFWIEFSKNINTPNFPQVRGYLNNSSQSVTNDNVYTFGFKPSSLSTSYDYNIKFEWIYTNGYRDDSSFSWLIKTSATASALGSPVMKTGFSGDMSPMWPVNYKANFLSDTEFFDSCAQIKGCVGKLIARDTEHYRKQTIRGKVKADIAAASDRSRAR